MITVLEAQRRTLAVLAEDLGDVLKGGYPDYLDITVAGSVSTLITELRSNVVRGNPLMTLYLEGDLLLGEEDLSALRECNVQCVDLGARNAGTDPLEALALIRNGVEYGVAVRWSGVMLNSLSGSDLSHLPDPKGDGLCLGENWREAHAYGRLFYRKGPDFTLVVDRREGQTEARYTLDDPAYVGALQAIRTPRRIDELPARQQRALVELVELDLAVQANGMAVGLPYRLRRWPIPVDTL